MIEDKFLKDLKNNMQNLKVAKLYLGYRKADKIISKLKEIDLYNKELKLIIQRHQNMKKY
ncbi:MAG: hypothetical protein V3V33_15060 [Candidatus Lokiarchaeia archaeon]